MRSSAPFNETAGRREMIRSSRAVAVALACFVLGSRTVSLVAEETENGATALIGLGDSLTHGTMDATNNALNTGHAYLQRVRNALGQRLALVFSQPWFDVNEQRVDPARVPTNLAVDGADSFTLEGLDYYKRAGTAQSLVRSSLLADKLLPSTFEDKYDKVLYPINVLAGRPIAPMGSAEWLLRQALPASGVTRAITVYWVGNNDSSTAALGFGGANPTFVPLPPEQLMPVLPRVSLLLQLGQSVGALSVEPYSAASIERNLTALDDFAAQQARLVQRLVAATAGAPVENHVFVLTLPYYSAVGYLFDSEDLEFYLRKVNPAYRVPASFARVASPGAPLGDPLKGDRISLLTFGIMYALLDSGLPVGFVNEVLEKDGAQRDGLVLSEAEARQIMTRIDGFNAVLRSVAHSAGPRVHVVEVGAVLNDVLTGRLPLTIGGRQISRKWARGGAFTLDGVHPSYTGQAFIANLVLSRINTELGLDAPLGSLPSVMAADPYVDRDGDGWAAGPDYQHDGFTGLLFLFKDPDDTDRDVQVTLPPDVWERIKDVLLGAVLTGAPQLRTEAESLGLIAAR
jgi:lysophospholipase L1-like esterase